jgi:hypothetical protein
MQHTTRLIQSAILNYARLTSQRAKEFHYTEAIRLYPLYVSAYVNLGALYSQQGKDDNAVEVSFAIEFKLQSQTDVSRSHGCSLQESTLFYVPRHDLPQHGVLLCKAGRLQACPRGILHLSQVGDIVMLLR